MPQQFQQPQQFQPQTQGIDAMINQAASMAGTSPAGAMNGAPSGRIKGIVKNWNEEKGFGFVDPVGGGENVFIHRSALADGSMLVPQSPVEYELGWNAQKHKVQHLVNNLHQLQVLLRQALEPQLPLHQ